MKVHEILKEDEFDDAASPESKFSDSNLGYALNDMAIQEIINIEENPSEYYGGRGTNISAETRQQIEQALGAADDKTLELIGNSKMVQRAIEDNYNSEADRSFLPLDILMSVIGKLQARQQKVPNNERIGYDADRPGYDDAQAYDKPPTGSGIR